MTTEMLKEMKTYFLHFKSFENLHNIYKKKEAYAENKIDFLNKTGNGT